MKKEIKKHKTMQGARDSFKLFAVILMVLACITGCKKDSDDSGGSGAPSNLSTPSWLQGTWKGEGGSTLKITKDDIIVDGKTFKETYVQSGNTNISIEQTKKTESLYVLTVNATDDEGEYEECHVFKIGDGNYIYVANEIDPEQLSDMDNITFEKFDKVSDGGNETGKFAPPSWIIGSWEDEDGTVTFSKNDVLFNGKAIKDTYEGCTNLSIKETKNTSSLYVITIKGKSGGENFEEYFAFKKGDGSYILVANEDSDVSLDDAEFDRLEKVGGGGGGGGEIGTLAPPSWIKGSWKAPNGNIVEFTNTDVIMAGTSLSDYGLQESVTNTYYQLSDSEYWMKFERGDGSYIDMSDAEAPDDKVRLTKVN